MSPTGHKITAAALGLVLGYGYYSDGLVIEGLMMFAGAMLGARAPDWTEIARWSNGVRHSLIPHRGPTHWPGFWLGGLYAAGIWVPEPYYAAANGFLLAALLHLIMDIMTPTGIPLLHPFAKKVSLNIYRSGAVVSEFALIVMIWGAAAGYYLIYQ